MKRTISCFAVVLTVLLIMAITLITGCGSKGDVTGTYKSDGSTLTLRSDNTYSLSSGGGGGGFGYASDGDYKVEEGYVVLEIDEKYKIDGDTLISSGGAKYVKQ
jgi:hypothetical protein